MIAAIANANSAVVYDLLFRTSTQALTTIAAEPEHLGAPGRHHHRAPHPGPGGVTPAAVGCAIAGAFALAIPAVCLPQTARLLPEGSEHSARGR
jgi:hypothetical protein